MTDVDNGVHVREFADTADDNGWKAMVRIQGLVGEFCKVEFHRQSLTPWCEELGSYKGFLCVSRDRDFLGLYDSKDGVMRDVGCCIIASITKICDYAGTNSEFSKKGIEDFAKDWIVGLEEGVMQSKFEGAMQPKFKVGDRVRVVNYESQPGFQLVGDGKQLLGKCGLIESGRYAKDGTTVIARVSIPYMGNWHLPLSCLEHSNTPVEGIDELVEESRSDSFSKVFLDAYGEGPLKKVVPRYDASGIAPEGTFKDPSRVTLQEMAKAINEGKVPCFGEGVFAKVDLNTNRIELHQPLTGVGGTWSCEDSCEDSIPRADKFSVCPSRADLLPYVGKICDVTFKSLNRHDEGLFCLHGQQDLAGVILSPVSMLKCSFDEIHFISIVGGSPTTDDLGCYVKAGWMLRSEEASESKLKEVLKDGAVSEDSKYLINELKVTGTFPDAEDSQDTQFTFSYFKDRPVATLKMLKEARKDLLKASLRAADSDFQILSQELVPYIERKMEAPPYYTHSMELEFPDGSRITVPPPGEGWREAEVVNLDLPHRYVHTVDSQKTAADLFYTEITKRGSSWDCRLEVSHELGRCFLHDYARRIEAECTRLVSYIKWER